MGTNDMKRLIVISNRLPVTFTIKKNTVSTVTSSGGLVSSLKSYIDQLLAVNNDTEVAWVGSVDLAENKFKQHFNGTEVVQDDFTLYPVFLPSETQDRFYNGFCNDTIWPLFHYFPSYAKFKEEDYGHYTKANQLFAERIAAIYQPGDLIWVHDYHLMLLPAMLKQLIPDAPIGFFLHIPFPSFELYRLLPSQWRKEILNGLLGADLIGFHTNDYLQHFFKSVRQLLGYDHMEQMIVTPERSVVADVFPVSIDFGKFYQSVNDQNTYNEQQVIRKNLDGLKTVVSVDRLDYTKGLVNRLESFELFLEKYAFYRGKVSYALVVVPSRDIITKYRENKREIEETVSRINGKYGNIGYTPVIYQYRSLSFNELTGLYLAADVALITPVRDGMNLVAKEFVASWSEGSGVLILSETAGAAAEMGEALLVNPTDRHEIADAIHTALNMPMSEQVTRNEIMQKRLQNYNVTKWAGDFISTLEQSKTRQEKFSIKEMGRDMEIKIRESFAAARGRLLLFDYDGTLSPYARIPKLAMPGRELLDLLEQMGQSTKNTIVIISGRPTKILDEWFGHLPIDLVAEHGAFLKIHGSDWIQTIQGEPAWKNTVLPIMQKFNDRCAGTFTEQKTLSVAWHYRNADADLGFLRSRELLEELNEISGQQDFQVLEGNKVVEVRSRGIDKGQAAVNWINRKSYDFIMAIGDDKTDEDMFRVIPENGFSIRVGMVSSEARYNFRSQKSVIPFLQKLDTAEKAEKKTLPERR